MTIKTLHDAFVHELSDMYNAEKQLTKALPKMAKSANDAELADAFRAHLTETEGQIEILDRLVDICGIELKDEKCDAMEGLVKEGDEIMKEVNKGPVRDAMLIAAAQKVEHYEIATYGTLMALAQKLSLSDAVGLLEQILDQEKATDEKLTDIAERNINDEAMEHAA